MINDLLERFPVDVSGSILVGEKPTDLEAGEPQAFKDICIQTVISPNS
jgi:D-glycero-D-manno-heptose 1,7-bisphosphate phosphatase